MSRPAARDRSIVVGLAFVPWAPVSKHGEPAGWILPGGLRTQDRERAWAAAAAINDMLLKAAAK